MNRSLTLTFTMRIRRLSTGIRATMNETDSIKFLQWVLLRWPNLNGVNHKVHMRSIQSLFKVGMPDLQTYRIYLDEYPEEWVISNNNYLASVSRFYRDQFVFECLEQKIIPTLISKCRSDGNQHLSMWSAGCARGEEPYSISMMWNLLFSYENKDLTCSILATDVQKPSIEFAQKGIFSSSSVNDLPLKHRDHCFNLIQGSWHIKDQFRYIVEFSQHDLRRNAPHGPFDLILCRNVAFTYFDPGLQRQILDKIRFALRPGGFLIIGNTETLPYSVNDWKQLDPSLPVYQNVSF